jgi:hypothetical protein
VPSISQSTTGLEWAGRDTLIGQKQQRTVLREERPW